MYTVLITGCDTGLGVELARQYAADGHRVIAACLDPSSAKETAGIRGNIELVKLDVTDHAAIETLSRRFSADAVDILLNNAGVGLFASPSETSLVSARRLFAVNFWAAVALTCLVLPQMRQRRSGAVINIESIGAWVSLP